MQFAQILFFPHTNYEKIKAMIAMLPKGLDKLNIGNSTKNPSGIMGFFYVAANSHYFMQQLIRNMSSLNPFQGQIYKR